MSRAIQAVAQARALEDMAQACLDLVRKHGMGGTPAEVHDKLASRHEALMMATARRRIVEVFLEDGSSKQDFHLRNETGLSMRETEWAIAELLKDGVLRVVTYPHTSLVYYKLAGEE